MGMNSLKQGDIKRIKIKYRKTLDIYFEGYNPDLRSPDLKSDDGNWTKP